MPRSPNADKPVEVLRFDLIERAAHWLTALLVLVLIVTGAILYVPTFSVAVGRRLLIEDIHIYAGLAVFAPLAVSIAGPWGRMLRRDLVAMNRMSKSELAWLWSLGRQGRAAIGKFNPGQKLNTFAVGGLLTVLLVTGLILRWGNFFSVSWRTSATFVHDWFALAITAVVLGHVAFALTHPAALRSMFTGRVTARWAKKHAPAWALKPRNGVREQERGSPGAPEGMPVTNPNEATDGTPAELSSS
jgi:formate dehydrogenase subunit gamma